MTGAGAVTLSLWVLATALSLWFWLPAGVAPAAVVRELRRTRAATLTLLGLIIGVGAALAAGSGQLSDGWRWAAGGIAVGVTVLGGGAVTTSVLQLAGATSVATTARVQRDVLRGGAWIGALERLALLGTLLAGWPEGVAVIVAVKGLARYPELRSATAVGSGANERFIIGTFTSLGWAAATAWVLALLLGSAG